MPKTYLLNLPKFSESNPYGLRDYTSGRKTAAAIKDGVVVAMACDDGQRYTITGSPGLAVAGTPPQRGGMTPMIDDLKRAYPDCEIVYGKVMSGVFLAE